MNEENKIEDILGVTEQSKPSTEYMGDIAPEVNTPSSAGDNAAESILSFVAKTILVLGIVGSFISAVIYTAEYNSNGAAFFIIFIGGSVSSIITWAACMVVVNISNNIRQIKNELYKLNDKKEMIN